MNLHTNKEPKGIIGKFKSSVRKPVVLVGMSGVGKTTIAKFLAKLSTVNFIDIDAYISQQEKLSIEEIFSEKGEAHFRSLESSAIREIVSENKETLIIISVGGGLFANKENSEFLLENSVVVWIDAPPHLIARRIMDSKKHGHRPLFSGKDNNETLTKVKNLLQDRQKFYQKAHIKVSVHQKSLSDHTAMAVINKIISYQNLLKDRRRADETAKHTIRPNDKREITRNNLDDLLNRIKWNGDGLVPVVVQDEASKFILMLAWENKESLKIAIESKVGCYFSRSRQEIWIKGTTSGNTQKLKKAFLDCDQDAILFIVEQGGIGACHTGNKSCFFERIV